MSRFVQGGDRGQVTLLPECLDHANAHSFCLPAFPLWWRAGCSSPMITDGDGGLVSANKFPNSALWSKAALWCRNRSGKGPR
jgi:hypothetical protein